jgi:hypothetical protein
MKYLLVLLFVYCCDIKLTAQKNIEKISIHTQFPKTLHRNEALELKVAIINSLLKETTGTITLELFNTEKNTSVDGWFINIFPYQYFTATPNKTFSASFPITVPGTFKGKIRIAVTAICGQTKDSVSHFISIP